MFNFRHREALLTFLCTTILMLPFFTLHTLSRPAIFWRFGNRPQTHITAQLNTKPGSLGMVLSRASMPNKTVIITTLNQAWAGQSSMVDLFLESFRVGEGTAKLIDHLVIVALDQEAYNRCISIHKHCFILRTEGVDFSAEKFFMSEDYLKMMWRRIDFLRLVLEEGYNFLFSDADIMWLRNPLPHLYPDADFQIACDHFNGYPSSLKNRPNGGLLFARSNARTIEFYKYWYRSRETYPGKHDQDVLIAIKYDNDLADIGVQIKFLDTKYFGGFCEGGKDLERVCTLHANCCLGLENKIDDLSLVLADWRWYMSMTIREKMLLRPSWRAPRSCNFGL